MLRLLHVSFWILPAIARENIRSYVERGNNDVSYCVKDIIGDIIDHNEFILDVILLNMDDAVQIHKIHGLKRARFITRSFSWIKGKVCKRIYVTSTADFEEFQNGINQNMKDIHFNPLANFIIVLENFNDYHRREMVRFLVFNNIYNATILARDDGVGYGIYSLQSPIQPCHQRERIVKVSDCSSYIRGTHIFPKIANLRGCNFSFVTHNFFPLINLDNLYEEGIEQKIIRHFAKYSGTDIQLLPYTRMDKFGEVVSNFHYTNILEKVLTSDAEGAIGGYFITDNGTEKMFSLSYPLTIDNVMVIVPRSNYMNAWHSFFNRKTLIPVVLVFSVIIAFSISAYFLSLFPAHHTDPVRDTLIVFGYFLNKFIIRKFKSGMPETIIISSLLFAIIIIPYTIQAFMLSVKTHPMRGWEAKNYDEVTQNYQIIAPHDWKKVGELKNWKKCYSRLDCLKYVRDHKDKLYYTLLAESVYESYKWMIADEQCKLRLYKLKEPVGVLLRTIYFRRGSVLKKPFDIFFFRLTAAGLVDQHQKAIILRQQLKCKPQFRPEVAPLQMRDFKMTYNLLVGGYCISAAVFAYEVLARKK